jgi:hypothetical protein
MPSTVLSIVVMLSLSMVVLTESMEASRDVP